MTTSIKATARDRLQAYLREHGVSFTLRHHSPACTASMQRPASTFQSDQLAKPVVVVADGRRLMLVLPASYMVQMHELAIALGVEQVVLATEQDLVQIFSDCGVGAVPPFGNLYGLKVYVDQTRAQDEDIEFRAGTHTETLGVKYADSARLVQPHIIDVARHR